MEEPSQAEQALIAARESAERANMALDVDTRGPPVPLGAEECITPPTPPSFDPHMLPSAGPEYALAFYRTTPRPMRYVVAGTMLVAHLMYLYGQLFPMWRLYYNVRANVTLHAHNLESRVLFKELGLSNPTHIALHQEEDIDTFTYGFAVKQLIKAHNLGQKVGPRFAAMILVLFSGVWPHAKLLLLHFYWLKPVPEITRTTAFYWLSTFGKWSLADVFVVCVMIGVLNLDLAIEPQLILHDLAAEIPEAVSILKQAVTRKRAESLLCHSALNLSCASIFDIECDACKLLVGNVYEHPGWVESIGRNTLLGIRTEGEGEAQLRIAGLHGIYVFCFAVVLSLLLSFFIDIFDHRARAKNAKARRGQPPLGTLGITGSPGYSYASLSNVQEGSQVHGLGMDKPVFLIRRVSRKVWTLRNYVALVLGTAVALCLVLFAIYVPSMERQVPGSLPQIATQILGITWVKQYSLWTLMEETGASGGPDFLLMGTFGIFIVFGPIVRAAVTVINLVVPMNKELHRRTMTVINFLGAFCAWEVFFVALFLVDMEMPPITNTILDDENTDACRVLGNAGFDPSCFEVEYNVLPSFTFVVTGGSLLMLVTSMAVKLGFKGLDPYNDGDRGGPYCCEWCPYVLFDFDRDMRFREDTEESNLLGGDMDDDDDCPEQGGHA